MANQSPIHAPLAAAAAAEAKRVADVCDAAAARIALLTSLDRRAISGRSTYLGPGGASATFNAAVQQALRDEIAEQLRGGGGAPVKTDISEWAAEIIAAFREAE